MQCKKQKKPTRAQVLKRAKEKDLQFIDHENAKVFQGTLPGGP
jgi:hypothetical protein